MGGTVRELPSTPAAKRRRRVKLDQSRVVAAAGDIHDELGKEEIEGQTHHSDENSVPEMGRP